jgi:hypothetical protein
MSTNLQIHQGMSPSLQFQNLQGMILSLLDMNQILQHLIHQGKSQNLQGKNQNLQGKNQSLLHLNRQGMILNHLDKTQNPQHQNHLGRNQNLRRQIHLGKSQNLQHQNLLGKIRIHQLLQLEVPLV